MKVRFLRAAAIVALSMLLCFSGRPDAPAYEVAGVRPISPPRITVVNDYPDAIEVWIVTVDNGTQLQLGSIPSHATGTFRLRSMSVPVKFVALPTGVEEGRYVTRVITLRRVTVIRLRVAPDIRASLVHVSEQEVGPCCPNEGQGSTDPVALRT